jgi:anthranilate synthase component 1
MTRILSVRLPADTTTPVAIMKRLLSAGGESFLLESVEGGRHVARYSFLGAFPRARVAVRGTAVVVEEEGRRTELSGDPMALLHNLVVRDDVVRSEDDPPFSAGAVGYLSYDAARLFERLPDRHPRASAMPDALFLIFDSVAAFDHVRGELVLQTLEGAGAKQRLERLEAAVRAPDPEDRSDSERPVEFSEVTSRGGFLDAVARARDRIAAGDIYQIQISRRWETTLNADSFRVYRKLRRINPSPYQFFLRTREGDVLGASPEMLVRVRDGFVETRPIAGTYPRGGDAASDRELERRFLEDPKERAEHVMLVDLSRNDLGRVCAYGSVSVPELFVVEKYSHVQHLVSSVTGRLRPGVTPLAALASAFPAGTLTGAPKIRAMELIDELEPLRRGIYGGAIAYLDVSGALDSCIAIRTMSVEGATARVQAAAGIVADSIPEREARETELKAGALFRAAAGEPR